MGANDVVRRKLTYGGFRKEELVGDHCRGAHGWVDLSDFVKPWKVWNKGSRTGMCGVHRGVKRGVKRVLDREIVDGLFEWFEDRFGGRQLVVVPVVELVVEVVPDCDPFGVRFRLEVERDFWLEVERDCMVPLGGVLV